MKFGVRILSILFCSTLAVAVAQARTWTDASGELAIEADLFGFDEEHVVLQRADNELGVLKIDQLSEEDREYLNSEDARKIHSKNFNPAQTWTTNGGHQLVGRIVDFADVDVTVQRRRGRTYVNDRRLANLPEFYRPILAEVIEHFEGVEVPNERAMQNWLRSLRGEARTFQLDGVVLEVENGDEYVIPFFSFSADDRKLLMEGWSDWLAHKHAASRYERAFRLEALAAAHVRNQEIKREIALIDLNLQAIAAGLTSAWEVTLYPQRGNPSPPMWVVMLGRNSAQATEAALQRHPGFVAGPVRRVSRSRIR